MSWSLDSKIIKCPSITKSSQRDMLLPGSVGLESSTVDLPLRIEGFFKEVPVAIKGAPPIAADPGGFPDFGIFRKMLIFGFFRWDLGSGRVCNGLEMVVGFKCTDYQLISSHMGSFSTIFLISVKNVGKGTKTTGSTFLDAFFVFLWGVRCFHEFKVCPWEGC